MDVRLGARVYTREGIDIGTVDRAVIDPRTMELAVFVVHSGLVFTHNRLIEPQFIDSTGDDVVILSITHAEAKVLPEFVRHEHIVASSGTPTQQRPLGDDLHGSSTMALPGVWRSIGYRGHDFTVSERFEFDPGYSAAGSTDLRSNVSESMVIVDRHTSVLDRDERRLGALDDVVYGADHHLTELVVRHGMLRAEQVRVPATAIDVLTHGYIRLHTTVEADQLLIAEPVDATVLS